MAVASPPSLSRSLFPSHSSSLCVSPCLSSPLYSPIVFIVLFVLPCTESIPHTTYIHVYTPIHIHIRAKCISCFRSLCVPSFDPSFLLFLLLLLLLLLFVVLFLLPFCSFLLRGRGLRATTYVCPDLKIVWLVPGRSP